MATTFPPKPNNGFQSLPRQLFIAFMVILWIFATIIPMALLYCQNEQHTNKIDYLTTEFSRRESNQLFSFEAQMESVHKQIRTLVQRIDQQSTELHQQDQEISNALDPIKQRTAQLNDSMQIISDRLLEFSERLNKIEERPSHQDSLQSQVEKIKDSLEIKSPDFLNIQKQVDNMNGTLHSFVKSHDFFQVVNNMMEMYGKKFNQVFQELDQKDEIIKRLLEASETVTEPPRKSDIEPEVKRKILTLENILNKESTEIPEIIEEEEEESFIHHVETSFEAMKEKLSSGFEETFEKMKDFKTSAQEKFEPVKEIIVTNAEDSFMKVKEFAQSTREKLKNLVDNQDGGSLEKVKGFAKSTGENLGAMKDFIMTNAEHSADRIKEISKAAKEKIEPMKEAVSEKAQQAKENMQKIGKDIEEKTKEIAEKAKRFAKKFF